MNNANVTVLVVGAAAAGFAAGYFVANKKARDEFDALLTEKVDEARDFYKRMYKAEEFSTPESTAREVANDEELVVVMDEERSSLRDAIIKDEGYDESETFKRNIFDEAPRGDDPEDVGEEEQNMSPRDPDNPYVISEGEWMERENGYEQAQLTYYEGDNTLTDDKDGIIEDIDEYIGEANLNKFGKNFAPDPNVLFVRNERLEMDFEVLRDPDTFTEKVLGIPDEELNPPPMKRKRRDERDD